jgi:hypothetical protein
MTDHETLNEIQVEPKTVQSWIDEVWHLWRSDADGHYATRSGTLTAKQLDDGYAMTLDADTVEELRNRLLDQPDAPRGGVTS